MCCTMGPVVKKCTKRQTVKVVLHAVKTCGGGGRVVAQLVLSLGDRWRSVVNTAFRPLYPGTHRGLCGPQNLFKATVTLVVGFIFAKGN